MNKLTSFAARFARLLPLNIIQREEWVWVQYRKGFRWVQNKVIIKKMALAPI